jgi:hypothetical protein
MNIELIQTSHEATDGKLVLRTQSDGDKSKLVALFPHDKQSLLLGTWDGPNFVIARVDAPETSAVGKDGVTSSEAEELARVSGLSDKDLKTLAGERGVKWEKSASRETMVELVAKAAKPPKAARTRGPGGR